MKKIAAALESTAAKANSIMGTVSQTEDGVKRFRCATTEAALIGTVLDYPETFDRAASAGIKPRSFEDERYAIAWQHIEKLKADNHPVSDASLIDRLRSDSRLNGTNAFDLIQSFHLQTTSGEQIGSYCEDLKKAETHRALVRFGTELQGREFSHDEDPAALLADVEAAWRQIFVHDGTDLPTIEDAADFIAEQQPEPRQLVRGILHQGSKLALGGGSKSFKTWNLLNFALSVAYGVPWMGFETEQGKVLYVNFEIQDYAWQRRIETIAKAKAITLSPGPLKVWNLRGKAADFQTLLPRVAAATKGLGFALIVLDPVYKLYGRTDENKATDVAALLNGMEALAVETGAAIAFGAHFAKGNAAGKEAIDRISGSGVFARDPDSILIFTRHEEEDAFAVEPILRNFPPVPPFAVRWQFPLMVRDGELDPSRLKQATGRKPDHTPEDLLALLNGHWLSNKDWIAAAEDQGISRRTFFRLKKALEQQNSVNQDPVTLQWRRVKMG